MFILHKCCLVFNQVEIPVCFISEVIPLFSFHPERSLIIKPHRADEVIEFLKLNNERRLLYGQLQIDYLPGTTVSSEHLFQISQQFLQKNQMFLHKYDNNNLTLCILNKKQLQQILRNRGQTLRQDSTSILIKELITDKYLHWWAQSYKWSEHGLFYLIYYKQAVPGRILHTPITYQLPKNNAQLKLIQRQLKEQRTSEQAPSTRDSVAGLTCQSLLDQLFNNHTEYINLLNTPKLMNREQSQDPKVSEDNSIYYKDQSLSRITEDSINISQNIDKALILQMLGGTDGSEQVPQPSPGTGFDHIKVQLQECDLFGIKFTYDGRQRLSKWLNVFE